MTENKRADRADGRGQPAGYRSLVSDIGLLTISNFSSKVLSFLLVPLYTSVLSTEEYGTYDLFYNAIMLIAPLLMANITDALLRFPLDKDADEKAIFTIGIRHAIAGMVFVAVGLLINDLLHLSDLLSQWSLLFYLTYVSSTLLLVLISFARGLDNIRVVAIAGVIGTFVTLALNIVLLLFLDFKLDGFFLASIGGSFSQCLFLFISIRAWKYISLEGNNPELSHEMRAYSAPLIASNAAWWVNNLVDRYIVAALCSISETGIYAVGSKIPQILNVAQGIFNQAWTISAAKSFDSDDTDWFFRNTYATYGFLMTACCSALIILDRPLARLLYAADFFQAWQYVPFLMIGMVFAALSGHIGGVFAAVKDTKVFAVTSIAGAVMNVLLNCLLVPFFGAMGSAIATTVSGLLIWGTRVVKVRDYLNVKLTGVRDYVSYVILTTQAILLLMNPEDTLEVYVAQLLLFVVILVLYRRIAFAVGRKAVAELQSKRQRG